MLPSRLHLATRLAALAVAVAALAGCQGISGIQPYTQVRVIDASPDAPALDFYQNPALRQSSTSTLYSIGFGTVSSYLALAPGAYVHAAYTAGTQQQLAQVHAVFSAGSQYTVLTGNIAANLQMTVLKDQSTPAPAGQFALRFLNQSTRPGAFDIYLLPAGSSFAGLLPVAAAATFGSNTGYIDAPSGTYSVVAFPAGATPGVAPPAYTGSQTVYPGGSARTIVLIDQPSQHPAEQSESDDPPGHSPALQIVTADDYDNPFAG